MRLKIAARQSDLAKIQAYHVGEALKKKHSQLEVEYFFRESLGDKNLETPLWQSPEKGVFTQDFIEGLIKGDFDCVVHSWKDLPTEARTQTTITATMPRADQRDLLLVKKKFIKNFKSEGLLKIYSSSPRREYNLKSFLPNFLPLDKVKIEFTSVRGNVQTRVKKLLESEEVSGLVVANAALDRLLTTQKPEFSETRNFLKNSLKECQFMVLPLMTNPSAAAQGALAIEVRSDREDLKELFNSIHCENTWHDVQLERDILGSYGGGCHQKIGVSVQSTEHFKIIHLQGLTDQGERLKKRQRLSDFSSENREPAKIWPKPNEARNFFARKSLNLTPKGEKKLAKAQALYVARKSAWQDNSMAFGKLLWTAGLKTWHELAQRGLWVTGCDESLGESRPSIDVLVGEELKWLRLTHQDAARSDEEALGTYELELTNMPDFTGRESFFWQSGSLFTEAFKKNPWLIEAEHACGPGKTYKTLQQFLGSEGRIRVFLDYEDWLKEMVGSLS